MKVLCIGHASYDISMPVEEYPKENTKYRVEEKLECGGGPAATAAYLLGKWDIDTTFQGVVGSDIFGKRIISEFKNVNVDTKYIDINQNIDTTISFILINKATGSRTLFNYAKNYPEPSEKNYDFVPDIIHVDGHNYETSRKAFEKFPNAIKVIDAGRINENLLDLCTYVDYLVCSKGFAEAITNIKIDYSDKTTLIDLMEKLEKKYESNIVVTLEEKGCLYKIDGKVKLMSGIKVPVKDTTGAGDIFHGAFVYGLTQNLPLEKILKIANITAGLSVKKIGTRFSIPNIEEVYKVYEKNK